MEAKLSTALPESSRRTLSQEMLALCAWSVPEQGSVCDLSEVLRGTPAHARIGLALWLRDFAAHEGNWRDPEMNPERFPQRRSTRLMIPHTTGNSDRVFFSLRLPEAVSMTEDSATSSNPGAQQVALHGERRALRRNFPERSSLEEEALTEFTGAPAPAWIMAYPGGPESEP